MRLFASLLAFASALVLALLLTWPAISSQPFPVPGYCDAVAGMGLNVLTVAAFALALWVAAFWRHARAHRWLFTGVTMAFFLFAVLFVSVPAGLGFAALSMLVRSK